LEFAHLWSGERGAGGLIDYIVYARPRGTMSEAGEELGRFPVERARKKKAREYEFRTGESALVRFLAAVTYAREVASENDGYLAEIVALNGEDDGRVLLAFRGGTSALKATREAATGGVRFTDGWGVKHYEYDWVKDDTRRTKALLDIVRDYERVSYE
jgi:hypothetical protein